MATQNTLLSSTFTSKPDTGSYRRIFKSGHDVHTDLLRIVSQIDLIDALNNNFESKFHNKNIKVPYLQSIKSDGTKEIITPKELLAMKLLVEKNENLPHQYELVSADSLKKSIPHPQLKQYLLISNPKKHIIHENRRFPLTYSTYFSSIEENKRRNF